MASDVAMDLVSREKPAPVDPVERLGQIAAVVENAAQRLEQRLNEARADPGMPAPTIEDCSSLPRQVRCGRFQWGG